MSLRNNYFIFTLLFWTLSILSSLLFFYLEKNDLLSHNHLWSILLYVSVTVTMCILLALFDTSVIRLDENEVQKVADRVASLKAAKVALQSRKLNEINSFSVE